MYLRRFSGRALPEVMREVRETLGPDAVILHARTSRRGWRRLLGRSRVEVLAAVDRRDPAAAAPAGLPGRRTGEPGLADLQHLLVRIVAERCLAEGEARLWRRLVQAGMDEAHALDLVEGLRTVADQELPTVRDALAQRLARRLGADTLGLATPGIVVLVGPTGGGKTLTAAKLAGRALAGGLGVELLDADDAGLGIPSRLEAMARVLGARYALTPTEHELARAVEAVPGRGRIIVDTPGVSPRDRLGLERLRGLVEAAGAHEVHLVLSATTKLADALAAARAFRPLGCTHLVFTRVDETASPASLLSAALAAGLPLAWIGTGPEVPTDLRAATAAELLARALEGAQG
jgi:flagellar biosynthesis protein FlhF